MSTSSSSLSPFTLMQEKVTDFVLLEDEGDSVLKMMMVTQRFGQSDGSGDKNVRTFLQIREYPSFNVLYELGVR
jgi:hypothetical protein